MQANVKITARQIYSIYKAQKSTATKRALEGPKRPHILRSIFRFRAERQKAVKCLVYDEIRTGSPEKGAEIAKIAGLTEEMKKAAIEAASVKILSGYYKEAEFIEQEYDLTPEEKERAGMKAIVRSEQETGDYRRAVAIADALGLRHKLSKGTLTAAKQEPKPIDPETEYRLRMAKLRYDEGRFLRDTSPWGPKGPPNHQ